MMKNSPTVVNVSGQTPTVIAGVPVSSSIGSVTDDLSLAGQDVVFKVDTMYDPDYQKRETWIDKIAADAFLVKREIEKGIEKVGDSFKTIGVKPVVSPVPPINQNMIQNSLAVGSVPAAEVERYRKAAGRGLGFSPFRIRLYNREKSGPLNLGRLLKMGGGETDPALIELIKGRYILAFDTPEIDQTPFFEITDKIPIPFGTGAGLKKVEIEKARLDPENRTLTVQLVIEENPIPLLALIGLAGAGLGLGGWGLAKSLKSVDRVLVDTGNMAIKVGVVGGIGYLGYHYLIKRK